MALSLIDFAVSITIVAKAFALSSLIDVNILSTLVFVNVSTSLIVDLGVALGLSVVLFRSRTGIPRTNSLIHTLMMYTVNTGLIVAIDAGLTALTYGLMPHNLVFFLFYLLLGKLYLNCYLAMLNARGDLREKVGQPVSIQLSQLSGPLFSGPSSISTEKRQRKVMEISASGEVETQGNSLRAPELV